MVLLIIQAAALIWLTCSVPVGSCDQMKQYDVKYVWFDLIQLEINILSMLANYCTIQGVDCAVIALACESLDLCTVCIWHCARFLCAICII